MAADEQGSIATSVRLRVRPLRAYNSGSRSIKPAERSVTFVNAEGGESVYQFDAVYGEASTQAQVFQDVQPVVDAVWDKGYNGTILAYGQTGSGKTHTLIGSIDDEEQHGLVIRAVRRLAQGIAAATVSGVEFKVSLTVVEIYCERIRDLLDPSQDNLQVKQDASGVYIEGATEIVVTDESQLLILMQQGLARRSVSATCMNAESSRSHCIVSVFVEKTCADGTVQMGKLCMVDLAGSERQTKTGAAGVTLAEGSQINKSLSCLANVIYALTDDKARHVPYRDSKLTRVLQDSLGGTARTVLIICCCPSQDNAAETLSTLRFGCRAKGVSNTVQVNQRLSAEKLQQQLEIMTAKYKELEQELGRLNAAAGGAMGSVPKLNSQAQGKHQQHAALLLPMSPSGSNPSEAASAATNSSRAASAGIGSMHMSAAGTRKHTVAPQLWLDVAMVLAMLVGLLAYFAWEDWQGSVAGRTAPAAPSSVS